MKLGIEGRRALVTGASDGIGLAIAKALAAEGVHVALLARSPDRLETAAAEITATHGVPAVAIAVDLRDLTAMQEAVRAAEGRLGPFDILVNSAGAIPASSFEGISDEEVQAAWSLKLTGYIRMARLLIPGMRERGWGRVVNIVGHGGKNPSPGHLLGGAANAALMNFTGALALEVAQDGILVNAINPGLIESNRILDMTRHWAERSGTPFEEFLAKQTSGLAMRRMGRVEEVADVAVFLCSERCTYVHGAIVPVTGGTGLTI